MIAKAREDGVRGLYRGFGASLVRDVSQCSLYYYCAEFFNRDRRMQEARAGSSEERAFWLILSVLWVV